MRHEGEHVIMKGVQIACFSVKELIQEVGTNESESNCAKNKFKDRSKLVETIKRMEIKKTTLTSSTMKYYYG